MKKQANPYPIRKRGDFSDANKTFALRANGSLDVGVANTEKSMTQQQFKDECDINTIMKKHGNDPVALNALRTKQGVFADFVGITDYQEMVETVRYADEAFLQLPAEIRSRFRNDPSQLLGFLADNQNYDEGVSLGLLQPKPETKPKFQPPENQTKTNQSTNQSQNQKTQNKSESEMP